MVNVNDYNKSLKIDCEKCFGLCCVSLYFSKSDGFPHNKDAGKPCINLKSDFKCSVHNTLYTKGLKGCIGYDCFGAGQKISQITFNGEDWRGSSQSSNKMFESFYVMRQLHEMLWYLNEAFNLQKDTTSKNEIKELIDYTNNLTLLDSDSLLKINIDNHRDKVNVFLRKTSEMIRKNSLKSNNSSKSKSYLGKDLRKLDLRGADLRGAFLIAANLKVMNLTGADFIGADLRDADFSGADLIKSIFLTQAQINSAKGDANTKLPINITKPRHWLK